MYSGIIFLLIVLSSSVQSSTGSITKPYNVSITKHYNISEGKFLLVERYRDSVILNAYDTFYTTDYIPLSTLYIAHKHLRNYYLYLQKRRFKRRKITQLVTSSDHMKIIIQLHHFRKTCIVDISIFGT